MKTINDEEISTLRDVIDFIECYTDYYYDIADQYQNSDAFKMRNSLPILKKIVNRKDFTPKEKIVERVIEKTITDDELNQAIKLAERHGRESVNPLFKFCVFNSTISGTLYLTDDYENALEKARSLSNLNDGFFEIHSIRDTEDGTYKLYKEGFYNRGVFYESSNDSGYLHFDYIRNCFKDIIKI